MINVNRNIETNQKLKSLYEYYNKDFLKLWQKYYKEEAPCRMNEFGIIDPERYDSDNGILFICRETNGWSNEDFAKNCLFLDWIRNITINGLSDEKGIVKKHPKIWYNTGRMAEIINGLSIDEALKHKAEALKSVGSIAYTNINKVRGKEKSEKAYWSLFNEKLTIELLIKEIEIIKPKYIVLCDKYFDKLSMEYINENMNPDCCPALVECLQNKRLITMPHPSSRMKLKKMFSLLEEQL